jgi:hypothetical protein
MLASIVVENLIDDFFLHKFWYTPSSDSRRGKNIYARSSRLPFENLGFESSLLFFPFLSFPFLFLPLLYFLKDDVVEV